MGKNSQQRLKTFCDLFYQVYHVPIYLVQNDEILYCRPEQPSCCFRLLDLSESIDNTLPVCYRSSPEHALTAGFSFPEDDAHLLLGPVIPVAYTERQLQALFYRKHILPEYQEACARFLQDIPAMAPLDFFYLLPLLYFSVTGTRIEITDLFDIQETVGKTAVPSSPLRKEIFYPKKTNAEDSFDPSSASELFFYMERGDVSGLLDYFRNQRQIPVISPSSMPLQRRRMLAYYSIALFSETARRRGLSYAESMEILNQYYPRIEASTSISEIGILTSRCAAEFTQAIRDIALPCDLTSPLADAVSFIRQHIYDRISSADIAAHIGYSVSHTSRLFRERLGCSPTAFLLRARLEEAKLLLLHTDLSIADISQALCFSSPGHLTKAFRNTFEVTPRAFRSGSFRHPFPKTPTHLP